jgi:hypothetical protein
MDLSVVEYYSGGAELINQVSRVRCLASQKFRSLVDVIAWLIALVYGENW